jgi:hypothetical protein
MYAHDSVFLGEKRDSTPKKLIKPIWMVGVDSQNWIISSF